MFRFSIANHIAFAALCVSVAPEELRIYAKCKVSKSAEMMAWCDKHNIMSSKLSIRYSQSGVRGLYLEQDTFPNEGIAVIPPNMIIRRNFDPNLKLWKICWR